MLKDHGRRMIMNIFKSFLAMCQSCYKFIHKIYKKRAIPSV